MYYAIYVYYHDDVFLIMFTLISHGLTLVNHDLAIPLYPSVPFDGGLQTTFCPRCAGFALLVRGLSRVADPFMVVG